jgi:hypothetical protein
MLPPLSHLALLLPPLPLFPFSPLASFPFLSHFFTELFDFLDDNGLSDLKQPLISKWKCLDILLKYGTDDLDLKLGAKLKLNEALKKYMGV